MQPQHIETHRLDGEDIRLKRFIRRCSVLTVRPPRLVECAGKETQSAIEKGLRGHILWSDFSVWYMVWLDKSIIHP